MDVIVKAVGTRREVTLADSASACQLVNTTDGIVKLDVCVIKREMRTFYLMPNESREVPMLDLQFISAEAEAASFGVA